MGWVPCVLLAMMTAFVISYLYHSVSAVSLASSSNGCCCSCWMTLGFTEKGEQAFFVLWWEGRRDEERERGGKGRHPARGSILSSCLPSLLGNLPQTWCRTGPVPLVSSLLGAAAEREGETQIDRQILCACVPLFFAGGKGRGRRSEFRSARRPPFPATSCLLLVKVAQGLAGAKTRAVPEIDTSVTAVAFTSSWFFAPVQT